MNRRSFFRGAIAAAATVIARAYAPAALTTVAYPKAELQALELCKWSLDMQRYWDAELLACRAMTTVIVAFEGEQCELLHPTEESINRFYRESLKHLDELIAEEARRGNHS